MAAKKTHNVQKFRRPQAHVIGMSELGASGLQSSSGYIREEFLQQLRGREGIRIYKEMSSNDPIIGAILFAVGMLIRSAKRHVKPFDEKSAADKEVAEFVHSCFDDMSSTANDVMTEILTMLPFGWSMLEIVYKKREGFNFKSPGLSSKHADGLLGWRKLPLRSQDSLDKWDMDETGGVRGMWQRTQTGKHVYLPISKCLLFRTETTKNNPEGRSVLRTAYRPWFFKKRIEEIEGIGIERDLAGLPVLTPPENTDLWDPDDPDMIALRREAETIVRNIRRDEQEGVVLPFGWELSLLSSGGSRNFDTTTIIDRYNNNIAMTVLADFIVLGHNNRYGSFALAGSKTHMFGMAIQGWLEVIESVFNRYAIPRLLAINGMDVERSPSLHYTDIEVPNLDELGKYIANLAKAGFKIFPNIPVEKKLLENAGIPTEGVTLGQEQVEPVEDDREDNLDEGGGESGQAA